MPAKSKRTAEERAAASKPQEYTYDGPIKDFYVDAKAEAAGEAIHRGDKVMLSADQVAAMQVAGHRFIGHGVTPEQTPRPSSAFPTQPPTTV